MKSALSKSEKLLVIASTSFYQHQSMSEALLYEVKNGVAWITFNTPKKKNAMSIEMYPLVTALMKKAEADDNVKVVVF